MLQRLVLVVVVILMSSGCGWIGSFLRGSDNRAQPVELAPIEQPVPVEMLWDARVGSGTEGAFVRLSPAVADGRVYAAGYEGEVKALDVSSGEELWEVDTELPISAGVGLGDDIVLVGTSDGDVLALRPEDGTEVWRVQVSSEILAAPEGSEGIVVVRTIDGKFTALDARSGSEQWVYTHRVPALTLRGTAPPLLSQGLVIAGLDTGKLLVLSLRTGASVFEKMIAPPRGRTELERMVDIDAMPREVNGILYVAAYHGNVTAIALRGGRTIWSRDFSSHSGLDVDDRRVYIADDTDTLWAIDQRDGRTLWKQEALARRELSTPSVSGNYVVVGDFEGYLHWLTTEDGRIVARVRVDSEGIAVAPVVHEGVYYVLGESGKLKAYRIGKG